MPDQTVASPASRTGRVWRVVALAEAATWAGLLVGMFLEYVTRTTDVGVQVFGLVHGYMFLVYVLTTIVAAVICAGRGGCGRWPSWPRSHPW